MQPKNIVEFKKLVKRYETITLAEIEKVDLKKVLNFRDLAGKLTGFGSYKKCTLCTKIIMPGHMLPNCDLCVYAKDGLLERREICLHGKNRATYLKIEGARSYEQLLRAYRSRARYLRKNYSHYL